MALNCFEVVRSRTRDERFVIYQSDFLSYLDTRLVVPVIPRTAYRDTPILRLTPMLAIDGIDHVHATHLAFSARLTDLRSTGLSVEEYRDQIRDAFDFLTSGF